uniref:ELL-associated factor 1 n=1 Tax=Hydra vulgaris TaxID=6087 RepID=T2M7W4_HYDVU
MAAMNGLIDGKDYDLTIGSTFLPNKQTEAYYTMRYDFKPASVDTSRPGEVVIGAKNECTVTIPNHDSGFTTYKGGKKPCFKECILIIDQQTGEIILERISSNIPLKKHRIDRTGESAKISQVKPSPAPNLKQNKNSSLPLPKQSGISSISKSQINQPQISQVQSIQSQSVQPISTPKSTPQHIGKLANQTPLSKQIGNTPKSLPSQIPPSTVNRSVSMSSDSSSSSESSDSESDDDNKPNALDELITKPYQPPPANRMSTLQDDLQLSDSNSDSD